MKQLAPCLLLLMTCCSKAVSAEPSPAPVPASVPPPAPAHGPSAIHANTTQVQALVADGNTLWVATRGGLEEYDMARRTRSRLYSTRDGLPSLFLESVTVESGGTLRVQTAGHACVLHRPSARFSCTSRAPASHPASVPSRERVEGSPVTAQWTAPDGTEWLGTAGLGLWRRQLGSLQRVTPTDQIASNHVVAITEWNHSDWFASFDAGLSRHTGGRFVTASLGPRMLSDVLGTPAGLFVATSEGLYVSTDGEVFRRELRVTERSVNDLAYDPKQQVLYVTATNSLWEIPLDKPTAYAQVVYQPGGSRALQAVDISEDGTVYLASEDRGVLRREGKRRFLGFDRLAGYPSSWAIDVLAIDRQAALFGSLRHGVFSLGTSKTPVPDSVDPWILFLGRDAVDPRTLYVGTQGGALVVESDVSRSLVGLPDPCVHSIARLRSGLWVGTEGGLAQYL